MKACYRPLGSLRSMISDSADRPLHSLTVSEARHVAAQSYDRSSRAIARRSMDTARSRCAWVN